MVAPLWQRHHMAHDVDTFLSEAHTLLGDKGFTRDADVMAPWLTDWRGRYHGRALALASPGSTEEVSVLVRLCSAHKIPIVPQGGNSGMSGGATPDGSGSAIILSLRRMNSIRRFDASSGQITCEAGLILQNLHDEAARHRLRFPLTLGGKGSATVGGLISTNAGGTQVLRHGTMRAHVAGIEAVLANGDLLDTLTPLKKDNRGFDLKQLLIGSEGTLGIVTAATLHLVPDTIQRRVIWAGVQSPQQARALLQYCERVFGRALEGFEIVPRHSLDAVLAYLPNARPPLAQAHPWNALIEIVASETDAAELGAKVETVFADALETRLLDDAAIAANDAQGDDFWTLRESISPAERAIGPAVQHDISVPVDRMADFITTVSPQVETEFPGTQAIAFGHLGDGNVHYHVLAPPESERGVWENKEGKIISAFIHDRVTEWNGSISAEHGIGQMKIDELQRLGDPVALSVMRAVKNALDPLGILNPGKLVPLANSALND